MLIEKMSLAEGLKRDKKVEEKIKIFPSEKIDLMTFFRKKYSWYFEAKSKENVLSSTMKVKSDAFKGITLMDHMSKNAMRESLSNTIK